MSRYIADPRHLRLVMKALADPSQAIAFEAFHVFKIFAANPNKTKEVEDILLRNRVRCSPPFPALRANLLVACRTNSWASCRPSRMRKPRKTRSSRWRGRRLSMTLPPSHQSQRPAAGGTDATKQKGIGSTDTDIFSHSSGSQHGASFWTVYIPDHGVAILADADQLLVIG